MWACLRAPAPAKLDGAISLIAHGFGTVAESNWLGRPWGATAKYLFDAALYGVSSGLIFYSFWH